VKIASFFIVTIIVMSVVSRATRSTELRITAVYYDELAQRFVAEAQGELHLIANRPQARDRAEYNEKRRQQALIHRLGDDEPVMFAEGDRRRPSDFESELWVHGEKLNSHRVLRFETRACPTASPPSYSTAPARLIVTSNKPFGRWGEVFGDDVVAAAMIDRLVHHAEVISMKGDSYRLKNRDLGRVPASDTSNDQ
jgi:hypothetical protein